MGQAMRREQLSAYTEKCEITAEDVRCTTLISTDAQWDAILKKQPCG